MPIIRRSSFGEQAGAAANAFNQGTRDQNSQRIRVQQLQQQRQQFEIAQAQRSLEAVNAQKLQDRRLDLEEQRMGQIENRSIRDTVARAALRGEPVTGETALALANYLRDNDPEEFASSSQALDLLTGGRYAEQPPTAEQLDDDPSLGAVIIDLGARVDRVQQGQRFAGVQDAANSGTRTLVQLDEAWARSGEGLPYLEQLEELAYRDDISPKTAQLVASRIVRAATTLHGVRQDQKSRYEEAGELIGQAVRGDMTPEQVTRLRERRADLLRENIRSDTELQVAWDRFYALADVGGRRSFALGQEEARKEYELKLAEALARAQASMGGDSEEAPVLRDRRSGIDPSDASTDLRAERPNSPLDGSPLVEADSPIAKGAREGTLNAAGFGDPVFAKYKRDRDAAGIEPNTPESEAFKKEWAAAHQAEMKRLDDREAEVRARLLEDPLDTDAQRELFELERARNYYLTGEL